MGIWCTYPRLDQQLLMPSAREYKCFAGYLYVYMFRPQNEYFFCYLVLLKALTLYENKFSIHKHFYS